MLTDLRSCFWTSLWGRWILKLRKEMQRELKRLQQQLGITFIYVTHDQEEALTMSDTVVVMNRGEIQQIGTPADIYNEPGNAFVASFIGESNIIDGTMLKDRLFKFLGTDFDCLDSGFNKDDRSTSWSGPRISSFCRRKKAR